MDHYELTPAQRAHAETAMLPTLNLRNSEDPQRLALHWAALAARTLEKFVSTNLHPTEIKTWDEYADAFGASARFHERVLNEAIEAGRTGK